MRKILLASLLSAVSLSPALASCRSVGGGAFLMENDTLHMRVAIRGSCGHSMRSSALSYFKSIKVAQAPTHGTLRVQNEYSYIYTAKPGYRGPDAYAVRVCGHNRGRDGCSTLTYQAKIL
jgi:hypothetical protein